MRLTSSRAYSRAAPVPKMPPGLVELMEGLTKDVLRNNPTNVYEFCANHLEKLLEVRDGPLPPKKLTLREKITKAQEAVRQRAVVRQQLYDSQVQHDEKLDVSENVDSCTEENATEQELLHNLRAPVHHDQELSLSSEVEISHEPTDNNSLTSKDSNFDESDEIPISKSSTFSSVSKSTVIDLMAGNDNETNNKEDEDGGIETPNTELKKDEQENGCDAVNRQSDEITKDDIIEIPTIEINNGEPLKNFGITDDQNDDKAIMNIVSSSDENKLQVNTESFVTQTEESGSVVPVEDNPAKQLDNIIEELPSTLIESKQKVNLKALDEVNVIIEEDENVANENEVEPSIDSGNGTDQNVEVSSEAAKHDICDTATKKADDNTIHDNQIITFENVKDEKFENTVVPTENTNITKDSEHNKNYEQIEKKVDIVNEPNVEVFGEENALKTDSTKDEDKDFESAKSLDVKNDMAEKKYIVVDENAANDDVNSKDRHDDTYASEYANSAVAPDNVKNENKEDNASSSSTSFQRLGSTDNNDDSSVIESDFSKAEDDTLKSDNENGQNNMDLETAAETVQKVFRSFLFNSRNSTFEDITNDDAASLEENEKNKEEYYASATANLNKERRPLGITRMDTVLQTVNEEKSLSLSTDDSSTLSSAATTIQAHVRGFLVRNRLNSYKTVSTNSLVNSNEMLEPDNELQKNKTVLNIHIVPEEGNYLSRDESLITSMDLSLDESPPSSINLHPLSYDLVSERRKLLKREDAIQSVSPPSNNSGKLSEDSVKEILLNENDASKIESNINEKDMSNPENNSPETLVTDVTAGAIINMSNEMEEIETTAETRKKSMSSDESDVITPFVASPRSLVGDFENTSKLIHSGEFHDVVLPTKVSRSDTTVVREFKNVLVYILLWNNS